MTCVTKRVRFAWVFVLAAVLPVATATAALAQTYEIHTYGNGRMLEAVFNGISAFTQPGGGLTGALKLGAMVGLLGILVSMAGSLAAGALNYAALTQAVVVAGAISVLSTSSVNVALVDNVSQTSAIIENIPRPIALIGYLSSTFGARLTQQIEQVVTPVDWERFSSKGLGWGPRVIAAVMDATVLDPTLRADLTDYIQLCVTHDISMGRKTADTIFKAKTSEDILGGTTEALEYTLPSQRQNPPPNQTCLDAYLNSLKPRLDEEATSEQVQQVFAMTVGEPNWANVPAVISDTIEPLLGVSQSATEMLKLRFAVNRFLPAVQSMSAVGGQSAMVTAWALSEAQAQQGAAWLNTGLLLQQVLPVFHAALEFLWYGFLLVGVPLLMVVPRLLFHMMATALWLQLWPIAYVFGNLFLYSKVADIGPLTSQTGQDWGLSLAATQPIQQTIQSAYAASGFPVMVGVIMLGAMVFGGSYGIQKAISAGPWGVGDAFGSAAALGNVSMGNMSLEQRTLNPMTQRPHDGQIVRTDYDSRYNPVASRVWAGMSTEIQTTAGRYTEGAAIGGAAGYAQVEFGGGVQAAFDPRSGRAIAASLPVSARTSESAVTQAGNALTLANQRVQQQQTTLENATASHVDRLYRTTLSREASEQAGISEGTREGFQRAVQQSIVDVLTSGQSAEDFRRHLVQSEATANLMASGGAPRILGVELGAGGRLSVIAQFPHGEEVRTTLGREASTRVLSESQESLSQSTDYQRLRQEVERHGGVSEKALGFTEIQRETRDYSDAVSRQNRAETVLRATQEFGAIVGAERGHLLVNALWEKMNPGANMQQAFKQNTLEAQAFSAYLKSHLSSPEGIHELSTEATNHLKQTGQLDQHAAQDRHIAAETRRLPAPSAAGLKAVTNPLPGSQFVEPTGHKIGPITQEVTGKQQAARQQLQPEREGLQEAQGRLKDPPTAQQVEHGIAKREAKTHGGPLTAGAQVAGEIASGVGRDVAKGVSEAGKQLGAGLKWLHEKHNEAVEHGYQPTPGP